MNGINFGRGQLRNQRGSYLVLGAFVLVVLMLASGLGVDIARKYHLEQNAQDTADAAAVAGAQMLPNITAARAAATSYIQQRAAGYIPSDNDIQIVVFPDSNAGTVGVLVRGAWDPIIMPSWLLGNPTYGIARYAIADMSYDTTQSTQTGEGTLGASPFGKYAIFMGDTSVTSSVQGNNMHLKGDLHSNGTWFTLNTGGNASQNGTSKAVAGAGSANIPLTTGAAVEEWPEIDASKFVHDVLLDMNNPAHVTRYSGAGAPLLGVNGQPVRNAGGGTITCIYTPATQTFSFNCSNSSVSSATSGQTADWGNGIDVKVIGNLSAGLPYSAGKYWRGSFQVSGTLTTSQNNTELHGTYANNPDPNLRAIPGKDNAGLAMYAGVNHAGDQIAVRHTGNMLCVYGVIYTPGRVSWEGNFNNYKANDEGTPSMYDASGNGFVKGSVICGSFVTNKQNFQVYYDAGLSNDLPLTNVPRNSPLRQSPATVWLRK